MTKDITKKEKTAEQLRNAAQRQRACGERGYLLDLIMKYDIPYVTYVNTGLSLLYSEALHKV